MREISETLLALLEGSEEHHGTSRTEIRLTNVGHERTLEVQKIPIEVGDRLILSGTGPVKVLDPEGEELGEKEYYRSILRFSKLGTDAMLDRLAGDIEDYAGEEPLPADISIISVARTA